MPLNRFSYKGEQRLGVVTNAHVVKDGAVIKLIRLDSTKKCAIPLVVHLVFVGLVFISILRHCPQRHAPIPPRLDTHSFSVSCVLPSRAPNQSSHIVDALSTMMLVHRITSPGIRPKSCAMRSTLISPSSRSRTRGSGTSSLPSSSARRFRSCLPTSWCVVIVHHSFHLS